MKVKICPLCDSEMKKSHYCDTCNSFIWKPDEMDIHYNTESRGRGEVDCSYGEAHDYYDHGGNSGRKKGKGFRKKSYSSGNTSHQEVFGNMEGSKARKTWSRKADEGRRDTRKSGRRNSGCLSKIIWIIIMISALSGLLGGAIDVAQQWFEDITEKTPESGWSEDYKAEPVPDENYKILSDEEVAAYGAACNGYEHFDMTGEQFMAELEAWNGGPIDSVNREDGTYQEYTYGDYSFVYLEDRYYFELDGEGYNYIEVNYDAVTNQIHSILADFESKEDARRFLAFALEQLEPETEREAAEAKSNDYFDNLPGEGEFTYFENVTVYNTQSWEDGIWLCVDPA